MKQEELEAAAVVAERAADRAREEILPRFRDVAVETKSDGSPVTEADRAAERAIREVLGQAYPDFGILGEEYGDDRKAGGPTWVIDPIDGTIAFSRGIPLFSTLIALLDGDEPLVGLIDLPRIGERVVGTRGGGVRRGDTRVRVSDQKDLGRALVAHGDVWCFDNAGQRPLFERMAREIPMLRGYTDAFGHVQVLTGAADAMVDLDLNLWDAAPTLLLAREAGGDCHVFTQPNGKLGLIFGSPALVEQLVGFLD